MYTGLYNIYGALFQVFIKFVIFFILLYLHRNVNEKQCKSDMQ